MIEKILEMLETLYSMNEKTKRMAYEEEDWEKLDRFMHRNEGVYFAIKIVQEVAKEYGKDTNVRSNADRIRSMSDEELAENNVREIFHDRWHCSDWSYFSKKENAIQHELEWLKSEVKE